MDRQNRRSLFQPAFVIFLLAIFSPAQLVHAGSKTIYAATSNGVFKSTDSGESWSSVNSDLPGHTFSLAIDPVHPNTVYAGTFGNGVFKTTDAGATWSPTVLAQSFVETIAIDPNDSNTLYAGIWGSLYFSGGVCKSQDGGGTWTVEVIGLSGSVIKILTTDSSDPAVLYAGTNYAGVFKTTDGARNWTNAGIPNGYISALAVDPDTPATLYVGFGGCSFNCAQPAGVFKSTDGGTTWESFSQGLTDLQVIALAVDRLDAGALYAGTRLRGLFKSVDGGLKWTSINPNLHPTLLSGDHFPLVADPRAAGTVYAGTTDGVFKSTDGGAHWAALNNGFPEGTKIFALAVKPVPAPTIESLRNEIVERGLGVEVSSVLMARLDTASAAVERGRYREARAQLLELITQIGALQQKGNIDEDDGNSIVAAVEVIIEDLIVAPRPRHRTIGP